MHRRAQRLERGLKYARLNCNARHSRDKIDVGRNNKLRSGDRHWLGRGTLELMSSFSTREDSDVQIVSFENAGGLNDFRNSALRDSLYELVASHNDPMLAIDLSKVDYLSSSGVAILVGLKRRVETKGGKIVIFHVQPIVRDLLAVMKLDRFFTISEDEAKAVGSLRSLPTT